eukprot:COSAG01_NODE_1110_length_11657_cov_5.360616_2_plen_177_part_00
MRTQKQLAKSRDAAMMVQAACHPNDDLRTQGLTEIIEYRMPKDAVVAGLLSVLQAPITSASPWYLRFGATRSLGKLRHQEVAARYLAPCHLVARGEAKPKRGRCSATASNCALAPQRARFFSARVEKICRCDGCGRAGCVRMTRPCVVFINATTHPGPLCPTGIGSPLPSLHAAAD